MHISRAVLTVALAATTASAIPTCTEGSCTHNGGNSGVAPALADSKPEQQNQPATQQQQRYVKPAEPEGAQPMKVSRSHQSRANGKGGNNDNNGQGFKQQSYTTGKQGGVFVPDMKASQPEEQQPLGFAGKKDGNDPTNMLGWGDEGRRFKSGDDTKGKNGRRAVVVEPDVVAGKMMDSVNKDRGDFYKPKLSEVPRDLGEEVELQPLSSKKEAVVPTFGQRFKEFVNSFGGQPDDGKPRLGGGIMRRFENPQQQQGASRIYGGESGEQPEMKVQQGHFQRRDQIVPSSPEDLSPQEVGLIRAYIGEQSQNGFERSQHLYQGEQKPKEEVPPMRAGNNDEQGQFPWSNQPRQAIPWNLRFEQEQNQQQSQVRRGMGAGGMESSTLIRAEGAGDEEGGEEKEVTYSIIRNSEPFDHPEQGQRGYAGIIDLSGATPGSTPTIIVTTHADTTGGEQHPFPQQQGPSQDIRASGYEQQPAPVSEGTYKAKLSQGQQQEQPQQQGQIVQRSRGSSVEPEEGGEEGEEDAKFVVPRLDESSSTQQPQEQQGWYDVLRGCFELAQAHGGEEQM